MSVNDERHKLQADLAELRRANEELQRLDRTKSDLLSTVSHELRTPLATIKEFTAILADQLAGPVTPDQQHYLSIIRANVDRLARIINNLLDMAKIDAGRILLTKSLVEAGAVVDEVVQSMRLLAQDKGIVLEVKLPKAMPAVFADTDKVAQVLVNLVSNAVKFTPGSGRVTISLEEHPGDVQFNVTDTGAGIAPADLPKLFEKFQQLPQGAGANAPKGAGLGLAISKRLVELHGGRIWAASVPGQGSTFSFTLPKYHMEEVLLEYVKTGLERAKETRSSLSVVAVSLRNMQELKALHGLDEVSRLLQEMERLLSETVRRREGDVVVRWQRGDLLAILAGTDRPGAQAITKRLRPVLGEHPFAVGGKAITMSVDVITATYPEEAATADALLELVERRLPHAEQRKTRILIVDDEPKIRHFIKEALELRDYEVLAAAGGPDALEQLKRQKVDLVLLDLMMPVMNGYEVYHLMKENPATKDLPVIIVTGKGERKDRELGMDSATYHYLTKPFQLEELLAKIREALLHQHTAPISGGPPHG